MKNDKWLNLHLTIEDANGRKKRSMAQLNYSDLKDLERRIQTLKNSLSQISEERWRAALSKNSKAVVDARVRASEKTLESCEVIATYVNHLSPPLSHEIQMGEQKARTSFEQVKQSGDANELHRWIKSQLIPQARLSERLGHLAVSSMLKARGENVEFHRWTRTR